jgi:hypothetical protein
MPKSKKAANWISVLGQVKVTGGQIDFTASPAEATSPTAEGPIAVVQTNKRFQSGAVGMQVFLQNPQDRVQLILNHGKSSQVFVGLNYAGIPYGIGMHSGGKWTPIATAGHGSVLPAGSWHDVAVTVNGSSIKLLFDGVEVVTGESQTSIDVAQLAIFLQS